MTKPIVYIVFAKSGLGGIERLLEAIAHYLISKGFHVVAVFYSEKGTLSNTLNKDIEIVDLNVDWDKRNMFFSTILGIYRLAQFLRKRPSGCILSMCYSANILCLLSQIILLRKKHTLIISTHVTWERIVHLYSKPVGALVKILLKTLYPIADAHVVVFPIEDTAYEAFFKKNDSPHIILNGINIKHIEAQAKLSTNEEWLEKKSVPVFLNIGRNETGKDQHTLLKAFSIILKERDARLIILGEGYLRTKLEEYASELGCRDKVKFTSSTNPYAYMARADVFMFSSLSEGFSLVLLESLACGLSIATTNFKPSASYLCEGGKYGYLSDLGDAQGLAENTLKALKDPIPPALCKERARDFLEEDMLNDYLALIQNVTKKSA
jgi:glycosyltransferase involved in cell wall biosynthesis